MTQYLIRRLLWLVLVLLLVTLFTYLIFFVLPSTDPAVVFAGRQPTPALVAQVRHEFGLDRPLVVQYVFFVQHIFTGDKYGWPGLGFSFVTRSALKPVIFGRFLVTMQLAMGAAVVWLLLGIPIGVLSALRPRSLFDRLAMGFALFGVSVPVFFIGPLALYVFWFKLHIAPGTGYYSVAENGLGTWVSHMIMPWVVLSLAYAAFYARMVRANLMETMSQDFIRTAWAKGLSGRQVVLKHGLRASLTPVVTMFGLDLGSLLGGAVIAEVVFNLPGLGQYAISSVFSGDLYAILDVTLVTAFFVTFANVAVDLVYVFLDPRARYV